MAHGMKHTSLTALGLTALAHALRAAAFQRFGKPVNNAQHALCVMCHESCVFRYATTAACA